MKKSAKIVAITAVLLSLLGASAFAFAFASPPMNRPPTNRPPMNRPPENRPPENRPPVALPRLPQPPECFPWLELLGRFLANATPAEINGTVVALVNDTLVLSTVKGHLRILLPSLWTVDYEVIMREQLFNGTFSAIGQNVTVKALKSIVFESSSVIINVMWGYEIINAESIHAFAVLPFNIEVRT